MAVTKTIPLGSYGFVIRAGPYKNEDGTARDVSAMTATFDFYPPGVSTPTSRTGTSGADGYLRYATTASDFDELGRWIVRAYAVDANETLPSETGVFSVVGAAAII